MNIEQLNLEALTLLRVLRSWTRTPDDEPDDGRAHPLYPCNVPMRNGCYDERPLWHAIEKLLDDNGYDWRGELTMNSLEPKWDFHRIDDVVCIVDMGGMQSVVASIEHVVRDLRRGW
jgi:hypothetical protein